MVTQLHLFELKDGHIILDGEVIRGIRECEFSIKENDSLAELSLKMDVRTLGGSGTQFDCGVGKTGKIGKEVKQMKKRPPAKDSLIGKIVELEMKYANENEPLARISFQIPYHDWKILKKSFPWLLVEKQLREIRSKYIQKNH